MSPRDALTSVSPLRDTLERCGRATFRGMSFGAGLGPFTEGAGATVTELLGRPGRFEAALAAIGEDLGTGRRDVQGSLLNDELAYTVVAPAVACLVAERRVPVIAPDSVAVRFDGPWPDEVAFLSARFACLAGDPCADHPDARPVADEDRLIDELLDDLRTLLAPQVRQINARTLRPARALWRAAADQIAFAFLWSGEALDRPAEAADLAARLLGRSGPLQAPSRFRVFAANGIARPMRVRGTCCLSWLTHEQGQACFNCPLTTDDDRRRRLAAEAAT